MANISRVVKLKKVNTNQKAKKAQTVAELKKKYKDLPLDFLFGITEEIELQCEFIDQYLDQLDNCLGFLSKINRCKSLESAKVLAAQASYSIHHLSESLNEDTRQNFEKLRKYGKDWKNLAIQAMNDSKDVEKYLNC